LQRVRGAGGHERLARPRPAPIATAQVLAEPGDQRPRARVVAVRERLPPVPGEGLLERRRPGVRGQQGRPRVPPPQVQHARPGGARGRSPPATLSPRPRPPGRPRPRSDGYQSTGRVRAAIEGRRYPAAVDSDLVGLAQEAAAAAVSAMTTDTWPRSRDRLAGM